MLFSLLVVSLESLLLEYVLITKDSCQPFLLSYFPLHPVDSCLSLIKTIVKVSIKAHSLPKAIKRKENKKYNLKFIKEITKFKINYFYFLLSFKLLGSGSLSYKVRKSVQALQISVPAHQINTKSSGKRCQEPWIWC